MGEVITIVGLAALWFVIGFALGGLASMRAAVERWVGRWLILRM